MTPFPLRHFASGLIVFVVSFAVLAPLIVSKQTRNLQDFDQPFYVTLAYDLDRYRVFSNGPFTDTDDTIERPAPGMFFGPVFPAMLAAVMKVDPRFAAAVRCSVEADRGDRDIASCDPYDLPVRLLNAFLLALAVVAIGAAALLIFQRRPTFLIAAAAALIALSVEANAFSYIMTESTIFALYSFFALAMAAAWRNGHLGYFIAGGLLLALLSLTKPSYVALGPVVAVLSFVYFYWPAGPYRRRAVSGALAFCVAFAAVIGAWIGRNAVSVGKAGFTEEYGSVVLIERFAYDQMTVREFFQAFPYCTPGLGELVFDPVYGRDSMHRFTYHTPNSFFQVGRGRRNQLVAQYKHIDPLIVGIIGAEMRANWWRYLLVSIPLAWCGLWAGWIASLVMVPLFLWACVRALRRREYLLPLYAAPAIVMLILDALVGNHYTRYNLILMGPYAVATAGIISGWWPFARWRSPAPAPAGSSVPSANAISGAGSA